MHAQRYIYNWSLHVHIYRKTHNRFGTNDLLKKPKKTAAKRSEYKFGVFNKKVKLTYKAK